MVEECQQSVSGASSLQVNDDRLLRQATPVKPSAQPTLVRTQHLPPHKTPGHRPLDRVQPRFRAVRQLMPHLRCRRSFPQVSGVGGTFGSTGCGSARRIHGEVPELCGSLLGTWRVCGARPQVRPADRITRHRKWERCLAPPAAAVPALRQRR